MYYVRLFMMKGRNMRNISTVIYFSFIKYVNDKVFESVLFASEKHDFDANVKEAKSIYFQHIR